MKKLTFLLFSLVLVACQSVESKREDIAKNYVESHLTTGKRGFHEMPCCEAKGANAAVASGGKYSTEGALEIYKKGGNAVDATVAAAFLIAVERVAAAGIGGGGFMTLHLNTPTGAEQHFVDFRETAPAKAHRDMYLNKKGEVIPKLSLEGALSVATPGFVAGMYDVHKRWGKLPWSEVLKPAMELARQGFPITADFSKKIDSMKEVLNRESNTRRLLFRKGQALAEGALLVQPELASTIQAISKNGKDAFYSGPIAKKIVHYLKSRKGILSLEDLKNYQVQFRKPIRWTYGPFTFLGAPPPSAGGVLMAQMFNVLSTFDLLDYARKPDKYYHLLSEVMSGAYADRSFYIGDPEFSKLPYELLTTADYAEKRRGELDLEAHRPSVNVKPGKAEYRDANNTTQISVIDKDGNSISCTLSINYYFGSGLLVPGVGVFLNDEMDDFSVKPGTQNVFGLTGGEANSIAPGKRMVSSMSPTIVLEGEKPVLAVGAAGGSKIISSVFQVSLNHLVLYDRDLRKAVNAPRIHFQWIPDTLYFENQGISDGTKDALITRGYQVEAVESELARVQAVGVNKDGTFTAASDPRDVGGMGAY